MSSALCCSNRCQEGALDDDIVEAFEKAVRELEKEERLVGITGDCGFMMHYQCLVRSIARVPVFMSALVQCPTIAAAFKNDLKILVVTANSTTLIPARDILLQTCGIKITDPERFVIEGLQDLPGFEAVEKGEAVPFKQVGDIAAPSACALLSPQTMPCMPLHMCLSVMSVCLSVCHHDPHHKETLSTLWASIRFYATDDLSRCAIASSGGGRDHRARQEPPDRAAGDQSRPAGVHRAATLRRCAAQGDRDPGV